MREGAGKGELLLTNQEPAGVFGLHTTHLGLPPLTGSQKERSGSLLTRPPQGIKEIETHLVELSLECAGT